MPVDPLLAMGPGYQNSTKNSKDEQNDNGPRTNGFHSHFNGIAIRVTLAWQPSSAYQDLQNEQTTHNPFMKIIVTFLLLKDFNTETLYIMIEKNDC